MAIHQGVWLCSIGLVLWTQSVTGVLVDGLEKHDLLVKDKKSLPFPDHIQDSEALDSDTLAQESEKRQWNDDDLDLALTQEDVKRKWGGNMKVWGKRAGPVPRDEDEKRAWNNNLRVWGKRSQQGSMDIDEEKRRWGSDSLRVWGKREWPSKKWGNVQNMKVWGKRTQDQDATAKRKWNNNMRVWGKRDGQLPLETDKRKWGGAMNVWGKRADLSDEEKRAWDSQFKVWGKRAEYASNALDDDENAVSSDSDDANLAKEKKAWDSNMRLWGKRDISKRSIENLNDDMKRGWDSDSMRVWGKRRNLDGPKRSWKNNVMRVWGKRSIPDVDDLEDFDLKRNWNSNNMRTWGKRSWDTSSMRTWGKRSARDIDPAELVSTLNELYREAYQR